MAESGQFLTDITELNDENSAEAADLADELQAVADTTSDQFRDLLTVMQEPFRDLVEASESGTAEFDLEPSRFKAAANEVIALCEPLLGESTTTESATGSDGTSPEAEVAPPADGGSYSSIVELQEAYVMAGGDCAELNQTNQVTLAAESGDCSESAVISTYLSSEDISQLIQENKAFTEELGVDVDDVWLIGQNWVINSDDAAEVQEILGGQLVSF